MNNWLEAVYLKQVGHPGLLVPRFKIGMTKYRKERSFRERKISHERKVLFQLFGSNYLFLLIQNTIFDMIAICFMFKMIMEVV